MDNDRKVREIAGALVAQHGAAALALATDRAQRQLAAGNYLSLLIWAKVSVAVAVMLDWRDRRQQRNRRQRQFNDALAAVLRRLREAGN
jgi:sensor domain CHASE-containing protein